MKRVLWVAAGAGVGALGWVALRGILWGEVAAIVKAMDWRILMLALGAVIFAGLLETCRWKLLLPKEKVSVFRLFLVKNVGQGINSISPVRVLGEVSQVAILAQAEGVKAPKVMSSIVMSKLFDLLVTVNLVGAGLIVLPQFSGFKPIVVPLWGMTAVGLVALFLFSRRLHKLPGVHKLRPLEETLGSLSAMLTHRRALAACLALTSVAWVSIGVAAWLVARAAGVEMPFWLVLILIVAVNLFTGAIPAPIGRVGAYELVTVSTLGLFAVNPSAALTFALVSHGVVFLPPLIVGISVLALERRTGRALLATAGAAVRSATQFKGF